MTFQIICDSACDIDENFGIENNVTVIPTAILFGKESYMEGEINYDDFLNRLKSGDFAKTSLPAPIDFEKAYKMMNGEKTLSLHITSKLSGTYNGARIIASGFENITVYDTLSLSIGAGYFIYLAVFLREKGYSLEKVIEKLDIARDMLYLEILIEDINYLKRGGRINLGQYSILGLFNLKPILNMIDGILIVKGVGISHKGALKKIAARTRKRIDEDYMFFFIGYSSYQKDMDFLRERIPEINTENSIEIRICTTLLAHTGPEAVGIGIAPKFEYFLD